jgi:hypothetical protein
METPRHDDSEKPALWMGLLVVAVLVWNTYVTHFR